VEAFPWSALAGPATVLELLRRAAAPNVGQLIDVWHFYNNGGDPDSLTGPVGAVQLNDGPGSTRTSSFTHVPPVACP
jgi:sugar phosphate isomerase/epimerase